MQCKVCESGEYYQYTAVSGVPIYRCAKCKCGFVDPQTPRRKTASIYSLHEYKKRENQFIERYCQTVKLVQQFSQGKKVLEVGGGFGLLSSMLHERGFEVNMLEPTIDPLYTKDSGVSVIPELFEPYGNRTNKRYDVIIMYDVIEHMDSPHSAIALLKKLLTKKGIVLIQTPNYISLMAKMVRNWSWWMVEDHRFFFSKKSLDILFDRKGWKEVYYETYEDWPDIKKNLDGKFRNKLLKRLFFVAFIPFYFIFRSLIWKWGF